MTDASQSLLAEQTAVVELPADARVFVIAGPGAGKTHALIHRADALIREGVVASRVLVLSFTNAVVGELRRRFSQTSASDAAYVRPVTIDSFAARIVRTHEQPTDAGFDETIRRATVLVVQEAEAVGIARFEHVIVDEAQDLVGARLEFVTQILRAVGGGFTVLGDPAQGIYGFSESAGQSFTGIEALSASFPEAGQMRLTHDHRSIRADAAPGHGLRETVLEARGSSAGDALRRRLQDSDRVTPAQLATILRRADSSTGVLCRTNGEVLFLSGLLAESGVDHSIRRSATDATPPAWVAERLANVESGRLRRQQFAELVDRDDEWIQNAWRSLRRLAGDGSSEVSLQTLRQRLARLSSDGADDPAGSAPVLSTIHRSKGLEYDTVVILEPALEAGAGGRAEEARVLYVAMTRARRRTIRLERPEICGRLARQRGRWTLSPWRGGGMSRLELRIGDVSPSLEPLEPDTARATQAHLRTNVRAGDAVNLRLLRGGRTYAVEHQGRTIATTRETFAPFSTTWPRYIGGLRVDRLRTEAGDPTWTANLSLGPAGFWLVPEIVGLGRLAWEDPIA